MSKIIVRADDLGYSKGINLGIAETVHNGIIKNVGVMVNMPETKNGLNLLKNDNICLGLHTNICAGYPLTNPKLIPSLTNSDGSFIKSKVFRESNTDLVNLDEVVLEIEAQYKKFVELVGEKPGYFEGHAVSSNNFIKGLSIVAQRHNLNFLGLPNWPESDAIKFKNTHLHAIMDSMGENYNPYKTLKKAALKTYNDNSYSMMICHPGYLDDYILNHSSLTIPRTQEVAMLTDSKVKEWLNDNKIELIKYTDL
ncbi:ChbG/HpnK family deacetylase [Companilactobacillus alimentarius]